MAETTAATASTKPQRFINNKQWACVIADRSGARIKVLPGEILEGPYWNMFVNARKGIVPFRGEGKAKYRDFEGTAKSVAQAEHSAKQTDVAERKVLEQKDREAASLREQLRNLTEGRDEEIEELKAQLKAERAKSKPAGAPPATKAEDEEQDGATYLGSDQSTWVNIVKQQHKNWDAKLTSRGEAIGLARFFGARKSDYKDLDTREKVLGLIQNIVAGNKVVTKPSGE